MSQLQLLLFIRIIPAKCYCITACTMCIAQQQSPRILSYKSITLIH